jgi:hypothetical protein
MVIVIHWQQVVHAENAGNVVNNSVFDDTVRKQLQYVHQQQYHRHLFDFLHAIVVVVVLYLFIKNTK